MLLQSYQAPLLFQSSKTLDPDVKARSIASSSRTWSPRNYYWWSGYQAIVSNALESRCREANPYSSYFSRTRSVDMRLPSRRGAWERRMVSSRGCGPRKSIRYVSNHCLERHEVSGCFRQEVSEHWHAQLYDTSNQSGGMVAEVETLERG